MSKPNHLNPSAVSLDITNWMTARGIEFRFQNPGQPLSNLENVIRGSLLPWPCKLVEMPPHNPVTYGLYKIVKVHGYAYEISLLGIWRWDYVGDYIFDKREEGRSKMRREFGQLWMTRYWFRLPTEANFSHKHNLSTSLAWIELGVEFVVKHVFPITICMFLYSFLWLLRWVSKNAENSAAQITP
jgi:hypothetical protein